MDEILYIENEIILSLIQNELDKININYFVKKTDIDTIPSKLNKNYIAIIFSEIENRELIIEIYNNIKSEQNNEEDYSQNKGSNKILKNIFLLIVFLFMLGIIISQNKMYINLKKYLNNPLDVYEYVYLKNGKETEVYIKKENRLAERHFDNNRNGIREKIIMYDSNGFVYIYEDANENLNYEIIRTYRNDELLNESISTKDNGVSDITYYYINGILNNTLYYNSDTNEIKIK